ncbi:sigma factor [Streptomyces sp. NPDC007355]|uniref:sigma factor n=1 Tax=Streptomyces sp. NPDC007355 TaxID=3364778 RepID=UPI0036AC66D1
MAEEALADACLQAVRRWPADGIPDHPAAWLTTVSRNAAIDRIRREQNLADMLALLRTDITMAHIRAPPEPAQGDIPDERLRLFFTCCHPALARPARRAHLALLGRPDHARGRPAVPGQRADQRPAPRAGQVSAYT